MMHKERTFVFLKPDAIQRSLAGNIIQRFEQSGLKIVGMKMMIIDAARAEEHYAKSDQWYEEKGQMLVDNMKAAGKTPEKEAKEYGRGIIDGLITFMTSGPVVAMVLEGNQAVQVVMKLVGSTEPASSDVGTIRGDYTLDSYQMANMDMRAVRNLVHCSDSVEEAQREMKIWFDEADLYNYRHTHEAILYDVNLDGILE